MAKEITHLTSHEECYTHTWVIALCTDTFSCTSHEFKEGNPRGGHLCVYPGLGQCFQVHIHLYMPFFHHS